MSNSSQRVSFAISFSWRHNHCSCSFELIWKLCMNFSKIFPQKEKCTLRKRAIIHLSNYESFMVTSGVVVEEFSQNLWKKVLILLHHQRDGRPTTHGLCASPRVYTSSLCFVLFSGITVVSGADTRPFLSFRRYCSFKVRVWYGHTSDSRGWCGGVLTITRESAGSYLLYFHFIPAFRLTVLPSHVTACRKRAKACIACKLYCQYVEHGVVCVNVKHSLQLLVLVVIRC